MIRTIFSAFVLSSVFFSSLVQSAGKGPDPTSGETLTFGDCTFKAPPAKYKPQQAWYDKFKGIFDQAKSDWQSAKDASDWKSADASDFDACAAFKIVMGVCWKESGLNPGVGPGSDPIPSPGICQIQARNCAAFGISEGQLRNPVRNIECAGKMMTRILKKDKCYTQGADQAKNGRCFTAWSVMIKESSNPKVGHRDEIRQYVTGSKK